MNSETLKRLLARLKSFQEEIAKLKSNLAKTKGTTSTTAPVGAPTAPPASGTPAVKPGTGSCTVYLVYDLTPQEAKVALAHLPQKLVCEVKSESECFAPFAKGSVAFASDFKAGQACGSNKAELKTVVEKLAAPKK